MTASRREALLVGEKPHCPRCDGIELRRQGRVGFLQRVLYPRMGLFPWECGLCRKIFLLKQRSTAYRQHIPEAALPPRHPEFLPPGVLRGSGPGPAFEGEHAG